MRAISGPGVTFVENDISVTQEGCLRLRQCGRAVLDVGSFRGRHWPSTDAYGLSPDRGGRRLSKTWPGGRRACARGSTSGARSVVSARRRARSTTVEKVPIVSGSLVRLAARAHPAEADIVKSGVDGQASNRNASLPGIFPEGVALGQRAADPRGIVQPRTSGDACEESGDCADSRLPCDAGPAPGRPPSPPMARSFCRHTNRS